MALLIWMHSMPVIMEPSEWADNVHAAVLGVRLSRRRCTARLPICLLSGVNVVVFLLCSPTAVQVSNLRAWQAQLYEITGQTLASAQSGLASRYDPLTSDSPMALLLAGRLIGRTALLIILR